MAHSQSNTIVFEFHLLAYMHELAGTRLHAVKHLTPSTVIFPRLALMSGSVFLNSLGQEMKTRRVVR